MRHLYIPLDPSPAEPANQPQESLNNNDEPSPPAKAAPKATAQATKATKPKAAPKKTKDTSKAPRGKKRPSPDTTPVKNSQKRRKTAASSDEEVEEPAPKPSRAVQKSD